ncbi:unnamed protein product [Sphagnum jensenii]|uniref:F-box domain-containing protein n=1 Tax=Sphagnum jensenii TaxID=128206 RepID=A0ABP0VQG3_9BRYO
MGQFMSFGRCQAQEKEQEEAGAQVEISSSKRQRLLGEVVVPLRQEREKTVLIPGLPEELALLILARVPRGAHALLRCVCKKWNEVLITNEFFELRKEVGLTEEWLYVLVKDEEDRLAWHVLDPADAKWRKLPVMPDATINNREVAESSQEKSSWGWWIWTAPSRGMRISGLFTGWFRRKGFLDRTPFCGCSAGAIDGCLYVLGGFSKACAMKSVWRYESRTNEWTEAAAMESARAYCKTGVLDNKLYAVGGVDRGRGGLAPLQSAEVYDPKSDAWHPIPSMPFRKAQVPPTAFLADMLKPIATGMASFKGQLCVPQSLYSWPFFVDVGGEVFDPRLNVWVEMPQGMGEDWPARQAGTKLSVVVNGQLYALDPTNSDDGSKIKVYDANQDSWKVVLKKVPILLDLTDSESPYLLAAFNDKLHVITKDINHNVTVLKAELGGDDSNNNRNNNNCCKSNDLFSNNNNENGEVSDYGWTSIATANFGSVELVTCQVLDL